MMKMTIIMMLVVQIIQIQAFSPSSPSVSLTVSLNSNGSGKVDLTKGSERWRSRSRSMPRSKLYQSAPSSSNEIQNQGKDQDQQLVITPQIQSLLSKILEQTKDETDGTKLPQSQREEILQTVKELEDVISSTSTQQQQQGQQQAEIVSTVSISSVPLPFTAVPLVGEHRLIYTDTERTPQYIGPIKGDTTQYFFDHENENEASKQQNLFQNRLTLFNPNILQIALTAERQIMDENRIKVIFQKFEVKALGIKVVEKELKQSGVWKMVFVGEVDINTSSSSGGKKMLLRIMRTPNLYILAKDL